MGLKVSFKEWIVLFLLVGLFISITGYMITVFFDVPGSFVTMGVLIVIFVIFKLYQWNKRDEEEDEADDSSNDR